MRRVGLRIGTICWGLCSSFANKERTWPFGKNRLNGTLSDFSGVGKGCRLQIAVVGDEVTYLQGPSVRELDQI